MGATHISVTSKSEGHYSLLVGCLCNRLHSLRLLDGNPVGPDHRKLFSIVTPSSRLCADLYPFGSNLLREMPSTSMYIFTSKISSRKKYCRKRMKKQYVCKETKELHKKCHNIFCHGSFSGNDLKTCVASYGNLILRSLFRCILFT